MMNITPAIRPETDQFSQVSSNTPAASQSQGSQLLHSLQSVDTNSSAAQAFYRLPQSRQAEDLFTETALQSLPENFRNVRLNASGEKARILLGIIASHIEPQDLPAFKEVCRCLLEVNQRKFSEKKRFSQEGIIASKLSSLLAKYGEQSFRQHISNCIEHCREAWRHHHNNHESGVEDSEIFKDDLLACHDLLGRQIAEMIKPKQSWIELTDRVAFFQCACESITKTLRYNEEAHSLSPNLSAPGYPNNNYRLNADLLCSSRQINSSPVLIDEPCTNLLGGKSFFSRITASLSWFLICCFKTPKADSSGDY